MHKHMVFSACILVLLLLFPTVVRAQSMNVALLQNMPPMTRQTFNQSLRQVKDGMTEEQVVTLLGKPDYIGHFDPDWYATVWFYGCKGPRKLPTLGSVFFDLTGRISQAPIGSANMPPESVISEQELG